MTLPTRNANTMIVPSTAFSPAGVARHYDELDLFYREVWGEHVHHGLWRTGRESSEQAVVQLVEHLADALALRDGEHVVDVGAGYGGTARYLAARRRVRVTAVTLSPVQHAYAIEQGRLTGSIDNPRILLGDWLRNTLPDESADAVIAIESTEHMADKAAVFAEMRRVLRPGGRVAIYAWIANGEASPWQVSHLLEPICREGRLAGMGTEEDYVALLEGAGLAVTRREDLSAAVRRTWPICLARVLRRLAVDSRYRRYLLEARNQERVFLRTIFRIWTAYHVGAMRYVLFVAQG